MKRLTYTPTAQHPFRQEVRRAQAAQANPEDYELKLFVLSYTAFFICFYTFIF